MYFYPRPCDPQCDELNGWNRESDLGSENMPVVDCARLLLPQLRSKTNLWFPTSQRMSSKSNNPEGTSAEDNSWGRYEQNGLCDDTTDTSFLDMLCANGQVKSVSVLCQI